MKSKMLTVKETSEALGYSKRAVGYWAAKRSGLLGRWARRVEGVYFFPKDKVMAYIKLRDQKPKV